MLRFASLSATGLASFDTGIGDLALKTFNGGTYLYATTGVFGGVSAWRLQAGGVPTQVDTQVFPGSIAGQMGRSLAPVTVGGAERLVLDVDHASGLVSYDLNSNGAIGSLRETGGLNGGGDIDALVQVSGTDDGFLAIAHADTDTIKSYRIEANGSLTQVGSLAGQAVALRSLDTLGGTYVIAADTATHSVQAYAFDAATGGLSLPGGIGADQGLGLNTPTALEVVEAYGQSWVIVAAAQSNSISVMRLGVDGRLVPTDHLLDTLSTRFEAVQDLALVTVQDRVFVVAGGGDDGLSLFTLTPDGRLVHLDSYADTLASGLQNVETLAAAHIGSDIQIFAAAQEDAGITRMQVSVATLGQVIQGTGSLNGTGGDDMISGGYGDAVMAGGSGDDILIAATGATTMTGGVGADTFVMRTGSGVTTITDFQDGIDTLDLTDFPMLRNLDQLSILPTAQGAELRYGDNTIRINSASNSGLERENLFDDGLTGPDHVLIFVGGGNTGGPTGPVTGGGGGSGGGSVGSPGVVGPVTVASGVANPALSDAEISFVPASGPVVSAVADAQGSSTLALPAGIVSGRLEIVKSYSTASAEITALDALQVLRIAVGLSPTWGVARPENLIAADINRDTTINALDALDVLRAAVGMQSNHPPEWVFLDENTNRSGITPNSVVYETGAEMTATDGAFSVEMTSILLGNMEAYV